jgi:hypothetical protein
MQDFKAIIYQKLMAGWNSLGEQLPERRVLHLLWQAWEKGTHITQRDIAFKVMGLGGHQIYEAGLPIKADETTLRKTRQIIRDLRLKGIPILSDRSGYWIPKSREECQEYLERIERTAKAQSAAWFETYRAMESTIGIRSDFFEGQRGLFENKQNI